MHRVRRCALALLTALVCLMPTHLWASASQDPLLDFVKTVAPEALDRTPEQPSPPSEPDASKPTLPESVPEIVPPGGVSHRRLAESIAKKWDRSPDLIQEILGYVNDYAYPDFPQPIHLLAIIAVESSFNPKAKSRGNVGLMQINLAANGHKLRNRSIRENIRVGADLLHEYYLMLKAKPKAAILSYNAGIGNYIKGRYNSDYWSKYQRELSDLRSK